MTQFVVSGDVVGDLRDLLVRQQAVGCASRTLLCFLFLLFSLTPANAQRISGELRVQVTDPSGAALQAMGTIVGQAAGVDRTFQTDESGRFIARGLPLGRYQVTAQRDGFAPQSDVIDIQSQLPVEHRIM